MNDGKEPFSREIPVGSKGDHQVDKDRKITVSGGGKALLEWFSQGKSLSATGEKKELGRARSMGKLEPKRNNSFGWGSLS